MKLDISHGMAMIRIITGLMMVYHGLELFSAEKMDMYRGWEVIKKLPFSNAMLQIGKAGELITGVALVLGYFTRISSLVLAVIMLFITFYVGSGKFWYEDQHPFVLALVALVFAMYGPGAWALDKKIIKR